MTSVVMIFEMTQDYAVIVPLMIANLVSLFIASRLQHEPIYEALAVQDGIHLPTAQTRQRHGRRQVMRVMQTAKQLAAGRDYCSGGAGTGSLKQIPNVASDGSTRCHWRDQSCVAGARVDGRRG